MGKHLLVVCNYSYRGGGTSSDYGFYAETDTREQVRIKKGFF